MLELILEICAVKPFKLSELASLIKKGDNYIRRKYITSLIKSKKLEYVYNEVNHPLQSYRTST